MAEDKLSTGKINLLDKHTFELIAAGEVVERPASVIKELVENSIDAKATNITVEIKNGGKTYIRVTDNGEGILKEDIKKAFLPHATSKVKTKEDLDHIFTLGFRGEALSSIAAVSRVEVQTATKGSCCGISYLIEGGSEKHLKECGCAKGTTVLVRDIFYNTPARMKFLKKDVSEGNTVQTVVDKIALSHPDVSIRFIRDNKQVMTSSGDGKPLSAINSVFGSSFAKELVPIKYSLNNVEVEGFITKPVNSRANRSMQNFFINGRFVKTQTATVAMEQAYKGSTMVGKFPACIVNVKVPFNFVDVNVHPAKIEVRFADEKAVFNCVYYGVKSALECLNTDESIKGTLKSTEVLLRKPTESFEQTSLPFHQPTNKEQKSPSSYVQEHLEANLKIIPMKNGNNIPLSENTSEILYSTSSSEQSQISFNRTSCINIEKDDNVQKEVPLNPDNMTQDKAQYKQYKTSIDDIIDDEEKCDKDIQTEKSGPSTSNNEPKVSQTFSDEQEIKIVGELFKTYLIVEYGDKVSYVDKHAAHEKILYNKLINENEPMSQSLLIPVTVTLDKTEWEKVIDNKELLKKAGFDIDDFGTGTVIVRSAPMYLNGNEVEVTIGEIAHDLVENRKTLMPEKLDNIYHSVACRAAIKAGDTNNLSEIKELIKQLINHPEVKYCPHGRPIIKTWNKREIEKEFGRIQ